MVRELREGFEDESAERARAPWSDGRMDGCEAIEVDEDAVGRVRFQDLEVGMVENNSAFFQGTRASMDDEVLSGGKDFRKIAEVEPAALDGGGGDAAATLHSGFKLKLQPCLR